MRSLIALLAVVAVAAACGAFFPSPAGSPGLGDAIDINNQTPLAITIVVNGAPIGTVGPREATSIAGPILPSKPWIVAAVSPSGRVLLRFDVRPGQVFSTTNPDGTTMINGASSRVNLPCGLLDVTVGLPELRPAPGPTTGTCEP